jgi:hypothetical protein
MKRRSSYKVTFLDRHGPAGMLRVKALGYAAVVGGLSLPMFLALGDNMLQLTGWKFILLITGGPLTLASAAAYFGLMSGDAAGAIARHVTAGGSSTPYEEQFSQQQALVMQREYAAALALYEQRIAELADEPRVRIAAAELYATHGQNPRRAAELYREVQRIPKVMSGHDVYVSNKLADLYLGPLGEPGRALVEFRRLIERYPDTQIATHARAALANIKSQMLEEPQ